VSRLLKGFERNRDFSIDLLHSLSMKRLCVGLLLFLSAGVVRAFGCSCGPPGPASEYVERASVVLMGKVVFDDDNGSGKFTQKTLVRFQVEESYKGLGPEVHDVWVDPGSFTSCYALYRVGDRYLVFGYDVGTSPPDTMSISVAHDTGQSKGKPVPPGFDPKNPPKVYWAPECAGTRTITAQTDNEVNYLRKYKKLALEKATVAPDKR
jgi:hypothetical protein